MLFLLGMNGRPFLLALGAPMVVAVILSACGALNTAQDDQFENEADPCQSCQRSLTDCSSRATSDAHFVACRDEYLGCQQGAGLGVGACTNPDDDLACKLCEERHDLCPQNETPELCAGQFDSCKARLIRNEEARGVCGTLVEPPVDPEGCTLCKTNYASCMSDATGGNTAQLCSTLFMECGLTVGVTAEACPLPAAEEACTLCITEYDRCVAAGDSDICAANFLACSTKLAAEVSCDLPVEGNGGAGGAGGANGAGGSAPDDCAHDTCEVGDALEASCNACATAVCDVDTYCCTTEWDSQCTDWAAKLNDCDCPQ